MCPKTLVSRPLTRCLWLYCSISSKKLEPQRTPYSGKAPRVASLNIQLSCWPCRKSTVAIKKGGGGVGRSGPSLQRRPSRGTKDPQKKRDKAGANKAGCERGAAVYSSVWYDFKVVGAISPRGCTREPRQALAIKNEGRN